MKFIRGLELNNIECWTDGSCNLSHEKRPGGWAYLIRYEAPSEDIYEIVGASAFLGTTHNQMELMAILQALKKINKLEDKMTESVVLYSDSEWAVRCLTGVYNCKARVVKSYLDEIEWETGHLKIGYKHISGHVGITENEMVNKLANKARLELEAVT